MGVYRREKISDASTHSYPIPAAVNISSWVFWIKNKSRLNIINAIIPVATKEKIKNELNEIA